MHLLPQDIEVDEAALAYASSFPQPREFLRQYLAAVLGYPLPAELLQTLAASHGIAIEQAHAAICAYKGAVFLRAQQTEKPGGAAIAAKLT